jgi:subtilisin family serine protease
VTIEGLTKPFYKCETCFEDLLAEQESIIVNILERFPSARVVSQTQRLANAIFLLFPVDTIGNDADNEDDWIATLPGVAAVHEPHDYQPDFAETVAYLEGASSPLRETLCVTGAGVRVAVLDSGIDYTHAALDGTGTTSAYIAAYGTSATASANQQRQGLFPTLRVVEGYDFLGDSVNQANENTRVVDDDPIDGPRGHGTSVSSVIVAVAPNVELVAVKVCFSGIEGLRGCPDFAILEGLEYVLDINRDGNTEDRVDIVNCKYTSCIFTENAAYSVV